MTEEQLRRLTLQAHIAVLALYDAVADARADGVSHHRIRDAAGISTGSIQKIEQGLLPQFVVKNVAELVDKST